MRSPRVAARRAQCGERDDQLGVGDAVQRDRDVVVVVIAHPAGELVDVEPVVVQDPLARREEVQSLRDLAAPMRHRQRHDVVGGEIRCGIGDSGDAVAGEAAGDVGERRHPARQRVRPVVGAVQPAVRMVGEPDAGQRSRVQDPHRTAAVLDPHRCVGDEGVELFAVELTCDRRVVADGPDPAVGSRLGRRQVPVPVALSSGPAAARPRGSRARRPSPAGAGDGRAVRAAPRRRRRRPPARSPTGRAGRRFRRCARRPGCRRRDRPAALPRRISMWPAWLRSARARAGCRRRARVQARGGAGNPRRLSGFPSRR